MSYLIDRQAVIDLLKQMRKDRDMVPWEGKAVFARIRKLPTIQPEKAQLSQEDTTKDAISRQAALEKVRAMQTYKLFMGDDMILVDKAEVQTELMMLPTIQPQSTASQLNDGAQSTAQSTNLIDRQAAIDVLDKIFPADPMRNDYTQGITCGAALATEYIKQLPPAQPEQSIPLSWIKEYIERLCNARGIHSELRVNIINTMIDEWSEEQKGVKHGATD